MEGFITKLEELVEGMQEISDDWHELDSKYQDKLAEGYPFQKSFDEVVVDVKDWVKKVKEVK